MALRRAALIVCQVVAGFGSLLVAAYGLYLYTRMDLRIDTLLTTLFSCVPMLSFPVFLLSFWRHRLSVALHLAIAIASVMAYSALNWRTCFALGYCGSVAATIGMTLATRPSLAMFGVTVANFAALLFRKKARTSEHS